MYTIYDTIRFVSCSCPIFYYLFSSRCDVEKYRIDMIKVILFIDTFNEASTNPFFENWEKGALIWGKMP